MSARELFRFGDIVESIHASDDNPRKRGIVVRTDHRKGKLNPGRYVVLTDGNGEFWECPLDAVRKIGSASTSIAAAIRALGGGDG